MPVAMTIGFGISAEPERARKRALAFAAASPSVPSPSALPPKALLLVVANAVPAFTNKPLVKVFVVSVKLRNVVLFCTTPVMLVPTIPLMSLCPSLFRCL